jgi:hypothetical protein
MVDESLLLSELVNNEVFEEAFDRFDVSFATEGRIEPRANKRRPKILKLVTIPRATYQAQILTAA